MMSVKRIAWGVVIGVVVMVIAYIAGTWSYCCQTAEYVRARIDESLHPQEWHLGDVRVEREEAGKPHLGMYRASMGDIEMWFVTAEGKDGEVHRGGGVTKGSDLYAGILPSEEILREELPEPLAEAADIAQQVAQEMRQHKPWPWSLRSIGRRVRDVAERRMRVEAYAEPDRGLYCSEILYGSERIFGIDTFGDYIRLTMRDDRAIASIKNSVLDFGDAGNTAYVDEAADVESLQHRVIAAIGYATEALQAAPGKPEGVIEMLEESRMRFDSQDYTRMPELDRDARFQLVRPWYARIVQKNLRGIRAVKPDEALSQPAIVAGVEISEQLNERNFGSLILVKDNIIISCDSLGGRSDLKVKCEGQEVLSLNVTEDCEFPEMTARFGGEEQEVLDEVRAMARDMLAVPLEEWPEFVWRDDLLLALKGVDEGRFYARCVPERYGVNARVMAEGNELMFSLSQATFIQFDCTGSLDVLLHVNGFEAYDHRSGGLLVVDGNDVRLTQRKAEAAAGKAFDADTFAALAGMLRDYEDEVPEELRQSLDSVVAFAADPQIPQATLVDVLEPPVWSVEHRQKRMEALQQLAKSTVGN